MADLRGAQNGINMFLRNAGKKELSEDELMVQMFQEVQYVWPKVGNPPLVTPFSQYVKNIALMNIMQMAQGKPRFSQMDKNTWDMILGKTGQLPGTLAPEIVDLAKQNGYEFYKGVPQDNYPDELPKYIKLMEEQGWDRGQDDEELFEYAMHERQYLDYRSGVAKQKFEAELEEAKKKSNIQVVVKEIKAPEVVRQEVIDRVLAKEPDAKQVVATTNGQVIWELSVNEPSMSKPLGTSYKEGEPVCWINAFYGLEEVPALYSGKLIEVVVKQGQKVQKGDIIAFIK